MAGIILKKTWKTLFIIMKVFLYIVWLSAGAACCLLKLFLLLLVITLCMVAAVSGLSSQK